MWPDKVWGKIQDSLIIAAGWVVSKFRRPRFSESANGIDEGPPVNDFLSVFQEGGRTRGSSPTEILPNLLVPTLKISDRLFCLYDDHNRIIILLELVNQFK